MSNKKGTSTPVRLSVVLSVVFCLLVVFQIFHFVQVAHIIHEDHDQDDSSRSRSACETPQTPLSLQTKRKPRKPKEDVVVAPTNTNADTDSDTNSSPKNDDLVVADEYEFTPLAHYWKIVLASLQAQNTTTEHREYAHAISAKFKPDPRDDIAMVTHGSVVKLERLLLQIQRWGGPTSVGMYLSELQDIDVFLDFYRNHRNELDYVSFHILLEPTNPQGYPHNLLRNLALDQLGTDFFLAMDVDFVTPTNCHRNLKTLIQTDATVRDQLRSKTLLVLPAFERFETNNTPGAPLTVADTKAALVKQLDKNEVAPFHLEKFPLGHGPTNFTKWLELEHQTATKSTYPVEYVKLFEPYVVGYRHFVPRYWPHFRGFGFNKLSWIMECNFSGFQFAVLRDFFVVHLNHPVHKWEPNIVAMDALGHFGEYLIDAYGVPWKDIKIAFHNNLIHTDAFRAHFHEQLALPVSHAYDKFHEYLHTSFANSTASAIDNLDTMIIKSFPNPYHVKMNDTNINLQMWLRRVNHMLDRRTRHPWEDLWEEGFRNVEHTHRRIFPNMVASNYTPPQNSVTLATVARTSQLDRLLVQMGRWGGPVSVAMYIGSLKDIHEFRSFHKSHQADFSRASVHFIMEKSTLGYPINHLRNLALDQVQTDFFVSVNGDFVTPPNGYNQLKSLMVSHLMGPLLSKTLFVLPAFERFDFGHPIKPEMLPNDKIQLKQMVQDGLVGEVGRLGADNWWESTGVSQPVELPNQFEAFVLGYRHGVPRYWPYFRGVDLDPDTWVLEASVAGYQYVTLNDYFVVGYSPRDEERRKTIVRENTSRMFGFSNYLRDAYGTTFQQMTALTSGSWLRRVDEKQEAGVGRLSMKVLLAYHSKYQIDDKSFKKEHFSLPIEELLLEDETVLQGWVNKVHRKLKKIEGKELKQYSFKHLPWLDLYAAEFYPGVPGDHSKMMKNLVTRKTQAEKDDITLVTYSAIASLPDLLNQVQQWNGPASIAVYAKRSEDFLPLFDFIEANRAALKDASLHLLLENGSLEYPHNLLRNLALENVETDYFLSLDVGFHPLRDCHNALRKLISGDQVRNSLQSKTLYVLPAFDNKNTTVVKLPETKKEIIDMVKEGRAQISYPKISNPKPDLTAWLKTDSKQESSSYPLKEGDMRFEPFVLGHKENIPTYWPNFRGDDFDKYSWVLELSVAGYQFALLEDQFAFGNQLVARALNNKPSRAYRMNTRGAYAEYLVSEYHVSWEDVQKRFGNEALEHSKVYYLKERGELLQRVVRAHRQKHLVQGSYYFSLTLEERLNNTNDEIKAWLAQVEPLLGKGTKE
jgi:hypothetical protein